MTITIEDYDMKGAYRPLRKEIDKYVTRKSAGNYISGYVSEDRFSPRYVGRADYDVAERLKQHADAEDEYYKYFIFSYVASKKAAFERECKDYHHFGGNKQLDNEIYPRRAEGAYWKCPGCDVFG